MRKHTTIDIDTDLLREAGEALGTSRTTDTVHAALDDVVRRRRRLMLLSIDTDLDLDMLDEIRSHRLAERPSSYESKEE